MPTHYQGTANEVRALNAFIPLVRAAESLSAQLGQRLGRLGFTASQFGALEALLHLGPLCQRELGRKLLKSGGNITLVVDNLEKRGWVRRQRQTDDRRMISISLTAEGRRRIAQVFPGHAAAIARAMATLSAPEQKALRRLCRKLGRGSQRPVETSSKNARGNT